MRALTHSHAQSMRRAAVTCAWPSRTVPQRRMTMPFTSSLAATACTQQRYLGTLSTTGTPAPFLKAASPTASATAEYLVHTGYAAPTSSSPSYTVVDMKAFEEAIAKAAHASVVEVKLPTHTAAPSETREEGRDAVLAHTALSRRLMETYASDKAQLDVLLAKKAPIDRYVDNVFYPLLKYGCFVVLALQLGMYFNWIFFVFDWNLMEPTTYFLAYTGVFCSLAYHYARCGHDELTWKNMFVYLADRERVKMCERAKIDVGKVTNLQMRVLALEKELGKYELKQ